MFKKFEGKYLAVVERDDAILFNKVAGLPVSVVLTLQLLQSQVVDSVDDFLQNPALFEVFSYLRALPEGLIPSFFANQVNRKEKSLRQCIKSLPIENYCALRTLTYFIHSVCFSKGNVDLLQLDADFILIESLTMTRVSETLRFALLDMFNFPQKYFQ